MSDNNFGIDAAWHAAELLRQAQGELNLSDINADGTYNRELPVQLCVSGEGTAWNHTADALRIVLAALLTADAPTFHPADDRARYVMDLCYDNGESIAYNVRVLRRHESDGTITGEF